MIAIIDTGISSRAISEENLLEGANYLDPSLSTEDTYGHGTAVAYAEKQGVLVVASSVAASLLQKNPDITLTQLREKLLTQCNTHADGKKILP